ncbi:hypothetical protein BI036_gp211 [Morganella phage vB_MmoM_MP1]|uniref:Uncharacterized protein n=1 Tax=Morganella phage vB_MmoM_MP1 TaxID=1852628 RepID=A0A192YA98_9CAUD|nr:hypothetical protein BI036_gp211 [Morganella phage vB_MmoM_MP1]ANM46639.1 hypothetical protein MP1_gp0183 [Morganella phage vB_MmoM_MP1]
MTNDQKTKLLELISLHVEDQIDQALDDEYDFDQIMTVDQYEQLVSEKTHRAKLVSEVNLLEFINSL